jgi:transcription antitermination protein NusB
VSYRENALGESMANRHLSRSIVLQSLFEWDVRGASADRWALARIVARNADEFARGTHDLPFMQGLAEAVVARVSDVDTIIEKAAPEWPINRIAPIDRSVLRLGLYELLFADREHVPAKVAINEAIELAKSYGGEKSGKFVNGVLGAVYKEIGEPGKNEKRKVKKVKEIAYEDMPVQKLGGAVVYCHNEKEGIHMAFVHDIFGHWTLSKGKAEEGEDFEEATVREIKEEMGITITIEEKLGENEYVANDPEIGKKRKHVTYFLARAECDKLILGPSGGLNDARWFPLADIARLNFYEDITPLITKAVQMLTARKTDGASASANTTTLLTPLPTTSN